MSSGSTANGSSSSRKNARTVYLEERGEPGGGRHDIKTTGSSVHAIKCREVFAERGTTRTIARNHPWTCATITRAEMTSIFLTAILLFSFGCFSHAASRPDYIECQSNLDCEVGHCCTIGPIRYSTPQCKPLLSVGSTCRPGSASTINMTASYPDGTEVLLTDVHYIMCPCDNSLFCDRGVCKESTHQHGSNVLVDGKQTLED
ncbi:astakine [Nomia melanderi]|uniref:astakine n=1 Tax=Nomia melanderi TaxID=2448451 RepID=UPI001304059F|nr:astakine-like [Nomia melanderi]